MKSIKLTPLANIYYQEWLLHPASTRYHLSFDQILEGKLLPEKLNHALRRFIGEHLVFNSHVYNNDGTLYWQTNEKIEPLDFRPNALDTNALLSYIAQPFDLHHGPLYRYRLIRINSSTYRFVVVFHHILIDGTQFKTGVIKEIARYYNDPSHTADHSLIEQTKRLCLLEKQLSSNLQAFSKQHRLFWKDQLASVESLDLKFLTCLNADKENNNDTNHSMINAERFYFNKRVTNQLERLKHHHGISAYVYSLSVFAIILYRYTQSNNFAVTYPISLKNTHHAIDGAQININIIPYKINENSTLLEILKYSAEFIQSTTEGKAPHCYYPISHIIQDNHCNSLLNVYFAETCFRDHPFKFEGITHHKCISTTDVDGVSGTILLFEQEKKEGLFHFRMRYDKQYYNEALIRLFIRCYKKLFTAMLNDLLNSTIDKKVIDYPLEKPTINSQLLQIKNHMTEASQQHTLHHTFERQALTLPNRFAIVSEDAKITYHALNQKANQLAFYLSTTLEICSGKHIGICFERNEWIIISILAILKTGAVYVPLDPNAPNQHNATILLDSQTVTILTQSKLHTKIDLMIKAVNVLSTGSHIFNQTAVIALDDDKFQKAISCCPTINIDMPIEASNLAYIIYTSGTTGKPKGVPQRHQSVISLFRAAQKRFDFTKKDVWVLFHSYVFDFSIWEIWGALLHGGTLVLPTDIQVRDPTLFYHLCHRYKVTVLNQTPSAFYPFIIEAKNAYEKQKLIALRYVIIAGEALNVSHLSTWFTLYGFNKPTVFNGYGLTETTILTTFKHLKPANTTSIASIGHPLEGQLVTILDPQKVPLPFGAIGEIYIMGTRLSPGYLHNTKLNNEKFVKLAFGATETYLSGFKTGDIGRQLPNGDIEFLGRADSQVKISGYRIELHAIEEMILEFPGVSSAIVIAKPVNDYQEQKYLVAYYLSKDRLDKSALQQHLINCLPFYMQPKEIIRLEKIPLTINGKLAINELPEAELKNMHRCHVPAYDHQSALICKTFADVLNIVKIGMDDNFFQLGGDSLTAITLVSKLQQYINISVSDIFNYQTPAQLMENLVFDKHVLRTRLEKVKKAYINATHDITEPLNLSNLQTTDKASLEKTTQNVCNTKKNITTVLLTGATGFLGCNLLYQLLKQTNYNLFLLVRSTTKSNAINRIQHKFSFYFNRKLNLSELSRITFFLSDLEEPFLGLDQNDYRLLCDKVDTIIHAAALVKHYGDEKRFYRANVHATVNLLDLAHKTKGQTFHFISTYSVLNFGYTNLASQNSCLTEESLPREINRYYNIYSKTKAQAELTVINARKAGLNATIYRMGNLAFIEKNGRAQENIEDNAFYQLLRFLISVGRIADVLDQVEITPVDLAAKAVIQLFNKDITNNSVYHIFNPYSVCLSSMFAKSDYLPHIKKEGMTAFIDYIIDKLYTDVNNDIVQRFLCQQGWLEYKGEHYTINASVSQAKTQSVLRSVGFRWRPLSLYVFDRYINQLKL